MADFHGALELENFDDGLVMMVVHNNGLLVGLEECFRSAGRDVLEGAVCHRGAGLRRRAFLNEAFDAFGGGIRNYTWGQSSGRSEWLVKVS